MYLGAHAVLVIRLIELIPRLSILSSTSPPPPPLSPSPHALSSPSPPAPPPLPALPGCVLSSPRLTFQAKCSTSSQTADWPFHSPHMRSAPLSLFFSRSCSPQPSLTSRHFLHPSTPLLLLHSILLFPVSFPRPPFSPVPFCLSLWRAGGEQAYGCRWWTHVSDL